MIKFFRKIRYDLMEGGNTGKYLKYAIGEIVLVVVGILIALQINNWNENRKLKIQQVVLVNQLLEDAKADSLYFENRLLVFQKLNSTINYIVNFNKDPINFSIGEINTNGTGLILPFTFSVYESNLIYNNQDAYDNLESNEIKKLLLKYRLVERYVEENFRYLNKKLEDNITPMLKKYYKELEENKESKSIEPLKIIYSDPILLSSLGIIKANSNNTISRIIELKSANFEMIQAISKYLDENK